MDKNEPEADLLELTTLIVSAHVSKNAIAATELPDLIVAVHRALGEVASGKPKAKPVPAVSVNQSVTAEYILCLEEGKKFKSLKRHLTAHGMTPQQYRIRWGLPPDYPFVTPNYGKKRSKIAKTMGLGTYGRGGTKMSKKSVT